MRDANRPEPPPAAEALSPGDREWVEYLLSPIPPEPAGWSWTELAAWPWLVPLLLLLAAVWWGLAARRDEHRRRRMRRMAAALAAIAVVLGGVMLAGGPGGEAEAGDTRTRTRNGACDFGIEFGVRVVGPDDAPRTPSVPFAALRQGIVMPSNGYVELIGRNLVAKPLPGRLTIEFHRGPGGKDRYATIERVLPDEAAVTSFDTSPDAGGTAPPAPRAKQPADISAHDQPVNEVFRVVGRFVPRDPAERCPEIADQLTVRWNWNGLPGQGSSFEPDSRLFRTPREDVPLFRSRVVVAPHVTDATFVETGSAAPPDTNKATHTTVLFSVDDPYGCCGQPDRPYAIVQFVRHAWQLGTGPKRMDAWNLDGPRSQSERKAAGQPYDPTYTNQPAHGGDPSQAGNDYVFVGPWDGRGGGPAVTVHDYPGLLAADHERFVRAGGTISWEFVTLLVCRENPASAERYLAGGRVRAMTHFRIVRTYTAGKRVPEVRGAIVDKGPQGKPEYFAQCTDLQALLRGLELLDAFNNPRPHEVRF